MKFLATLLLSVASIALASPVENQSLEQRAPQLRNSHISFHTNDEDKDSDTHVTVTLTDGNGVVAARISNDFGHFNDNSDEGPYALQIFNPSQKDILQNGTLAIRIDPNGHDTWRFNFLLDMSFSDGTKLTGGANSLELTQNRRTQTFGVDGIVR